MKPEDSNYWIESFDVTQADITRIEEFLRQSQEPKSITTISQRIVRGRMKFGHDISPSALSTWAQKPTIRLWDPAGKWDIGDGVIVVRRIPPSDDYNAFVGEVIVQEVDMIKIHLDIGDVWFQRAKPGTENALKWHNIVREIVSQKMRSAELDDRVTGVMAQFGDRIVSRISEVLESDERFIGFKGYWYLSDLLPVLSDSHIHKLYGLLLSDGKALTTGELLLEISQRSSADICAELSLIAALRKHPDRFQNVGNFTSPLWRASLPTSNGIKVAYYAYDPLNFEIICEPGEIILPKVLQRLQANKLLAQVIEF